MSYEYKNTSKKTPFDETLCSSAIYMSENFINENSNSYQSKKISKKISKKNSSFETPKCSKDINLDLSNNFSALNVTLPANSFSKKYETKRQVE